MLGVYKVPYPPPRLGEGKSLSSLLEKNIRLWRGERNIMAVGKKISWETKGEMESNIIYPIIFRLLGEKKGGRGTGEKNLDLKKKGVRKIWSCSELYTHLCNVRTCSDAFCWLVWTGPSCSAYTGWPPSPGSTPPRAPRTLSSRTSWEGRRYTKQGATLY